VAEDALHGHTLRTIDRSLARGVIEPCFQEWSLEVEPLTQHRPCFLGIDQVVYTKPMGGGKWAEGGRVFFFQLQSQGVGRGLTLFFCDLPQPSAKRHSDARLHR
jgi:hypothetical protein